MIRIGNVARTRLYMPQERSARMLTFACQRSAPTSITRALVIVTEPWGATGRLSTGHFDPLLVRRRLSDAFRRPEHVAVPLGEKGKE